VNLNIKNAETYQLASQLADLTGETLTKAVTEALRERLERLRKHKRKATASELMDIGRRCAAHIIKPGSSREHGDLLYDERGLPQ
jgi:antitoxin VapB